MLKRIVSIIVRGYENEISGHAFRARSKISFVPVVSNLNLPPAAAEKAKEEQPAAYDQIREHRQPGAEQPPVASRPGTQDSKVKRLHGEKIGQRNSHAEKTGPSEKDGNTRIARAPQSISKNYGASDEWHGKGHQAKDRHADIDYRLLLVLGTKQRKHGMGE